MKTERMTILLSPQQKEIIQAKAKKLNLSAGEVVRRAVDGYQAEGDEALLTALAEELERSVKEARVALKSALAETRETLDQLDRTRAAARRAA